MIVVLLLGTMHVGYCHVFPAGSVCRSSSRRSKAAAGGHVTCTGAGGFFAAAGGVPTLLGRQAHTYAGAGALPAAPLTRGR